MFSSFKKKSEAERRKKFEDQVDRLKEANFPIHYHPRERREKLERRYPNRSKQRKFKTRKVFIITVLMIGFFYLLTLLIRQKFSQNPTPIDQLNRYLTTRFEWSEPRRLSQIDGLFYNFVIHLEMKENISLNQVRLGSNVIFDLSLFDTSNREIFNQKLTPGETTITPQKPLLLKTGPISQKIKASSQKIEFAIETHLNQEKI